MATKQDRSRRLQATNLCNNVVANARNLQVLKPRKRFLNQISELALVARLAWHVNQRQRELTQVTSEIE